MDQEVQAPEVGEVIENAEVTPPAEEPEQKVSGWDYKKDKRWGKMFKSEADIINSYHNLEKIYQPTKEQLNKYESNFKQYGIDPEKLQDYVKEFQDLKDPNRLENQRASYLSKYLDSPAMQQKVVNFFSELEKEEMASKFPGMSQEQIEKQVQMENRLNELVEREKQFETQKLVSEYSKMISENTQKIADLCKDYGLQLDPSFFDDFKKFCAESQIDPKYILHEFRQLYADDLEKAYRNKLQAQVIKSQEKKHKAGVVVNSTPKPKAPQSSGKDKLAKMLFGKSYNQL